MSVTATDDGREFIDPIVEAKGLADSFAIMSYQALDSSGGMNERRYAFLAKSYHLAIIFSNHPSDYERLKNEDFWSASRQKPDDDSIVRWVLYFTMRATSDPVRNGAIKAATVLERFRAEGVPATDVVRRLKEGGGVHGIYGQICAKAKAKKFAGDAIEGGSAATGDLDEGISSSAPTDAFERREDEQTNSPVASRTGNSERAEDAPLGARASMFPAQGDTRADDIQIEADYKHGALNRADLKTEVIVTMRNESERVELLDGKYAIIAILVQPPDRRYWRPVLARSFRLLNYSEAAYLDIDADMFCASNSSSRDAGERTGADEAHMSAQSPSERTVERSGPVNPIVLAREQSLSRVGAIVPQPMRLPPPSQSGRAAPDRRAIAGGVPISKLNRVKPEGPGSPKNAPAKKLQLRKTPHTKTASRKRVSVKLSERPGPRLT
jgi:hypothetical protein